ncbi:unnamed protein product [Orchesella dallaii]|uniref:Uncharacterized protein n=1 Tax=Orchesella dallaii TaxID=48710 RepID=A0ABP1RJG6_9HEXA
MRSFSCSKKMGVFCAFFVVLAYSLEIANCSPQSTTQFLDNYSVEPTRETYSRDYYYDYQDYQNEGTAGSLQNNAASSSSMQENFYSLFNWRERMSTSGIANDTFFNGGQPLLQEIGETCPKREFFYGMNPRHRNAVLRLNQVLMEQSSPEGCLQIAGGLRDRDEVNPHAWLRAVISASIFRPDLQGLQKPPLVEIMPSMFVPGEILDELKESSSEISTTASSRRCIRVDGSYGEDNGAENLVWYWREDVLLNSHHLYWHLSYPIRGERGTQDRAGELFYFMHHNMMARFHCERLSVGLPPVEPWDLRPGQTIPYGYSPHLHDGNSGTNWSARPPGVPISDLISDRPVSVRNRTIWLNRILDGISEGRLIDEYGRPVYLDNDEGINILGNTVQSNGFSVNPEFYGGNGIHNSGHRLLGAALDPRLELGHPPGVMGEDATAMRDIVFYPYHEFMDNIFNSQKNRLPPYQLTQGDWPLVLPGVELHSLKIHSGDLPINTLNTFWSYKRYDLSRGLDFNRSSEGRGPLYACHQHLNHQDFEYELEIERKDGSHHDTTATVRLFMGPRYDLKGRRYGLDEERHFMFIVDAFTVPRERKKQ